MTAIGVFASARLTLENAVRIMSDLKGNPNPFAEDAEFAVIDATNEHD
jgi:hypothetical protein